MKFSKTAKIIVLSLFTVVLILTGSLIVNLYNNVDGGTVHEENVKDSCQFHFWVGVTSIVTGVGCLLFTVLIGLQTETGMVVAGKLASKMEKKKKIGQD